MKRSGAASTAPVFQPRSSPLLAQSGHNELQRTRPLLGVKRTSPSAPHTSAFDPKRTRLTSSRATVGVVTMSRLALGGDNEATRLRNATGRNSGRLASR